MVCKINKVKQFANIATTDHLQNILSGNDLKNKIKLFVINLVLTITKLSRVLTYLTVGFFVVNL